MAQRLTNLIQCEVNYNVNYLPIQLMNRIFLKASDGHVGVEYKEDIEKKVDKVQYI